MGSKPKDNSAEAAQLQGEANKEVTEQQTWANRPNQYNPWGTVQWDAQKVWDPTTEQYINQWTQYETLNPQIQQSLDSELALQQGRTDLASQMLGRVGQEIGTPMDWSQYGQQTGLEYDPTELRQRAEDAVYNKAEARINPDFDSRTQQMEIKLRNQGLRPGDQAWNAQMENLERSRGDALERARQDAVMQGRGEAGQLYQQQMGSADYANKLRQQAIKEDMTRRGFSLNEINALLSGQQVSNPDFENYNQANRAQAAPLFQGAVQDMNAQQAASQGFMSGLGNVAGTAASMYSMFG